MLLLFLCFLDINECLIANGGCASNASCVNIPGSRNCTCHEGFEGSGISCGRKLKSRSFKFTVGARLGGGQFINIRAVFRKFFTFLLASGRFDASGVSQLAPFWIRLTLSYRRSVQAKLMVTTWDAFRSDRWSYCMLVLQKTGQPPM